MHYRREIDGLRALAVLPVILFHANFRTFSGGYVGVDVFFVISGYLITSIILADLEAGKFSIVNFYERRARRILPALFLVMFVCLPLAWLLLLPMDLRSFSQSLVSVSAFVSNILFWRTSGYFDTAAELKPLLHTWSLALEEQYYLLFPIFLMLVWRLGKRWIVASLAVLALVSLAAAQWGSVAMPAAAFFLLLTRGWELLIGGLIAFYLAKEASNRLTIRLREVGGVLGAALILYAIVAFGKQTPVPGVYTLAPTIGAALIIVCATQRTLVGKFLGNKLFVGIGLMSYSAYLWHYPLFVFARHRSIDEPGAMLLVCLAVLSIALAYLSWKFVEIPFRDKSRISRKQIFLFSSIGTLFFIVVGLTGYISNGFEYRLTSSQRAVLAYTSYEHRDLYRVGVCFLYPQQSYAVFSDVCGANEAENSVLIWGDSHAAALSVGLRRVFPNVVQFNASGCPPLEGATVRLRPNCKDVNDFVMRHIASQFPGTIILHANWRLYEEQDPAQNILKTVEFIRGVSPSTEIVVVGPVPQWDHSLPVFLARKEIDLDGHHYLFTRALQELRMIDDNLEKASKAAGVTFLSVLDVLCKDEQCLATADHQNKIIPTAWDYGHLTEGGSIFLAQRLFK